MCKSKPPPQPDYNAQAKAQSEAVKAQTQEQYQMDLLTALMTAGKIPVMDIADPEARKAMFDTIANMPEGQDNPYDLSNPFPGFLDEVGDQIIGDIIEAAEALPDFSTRFEGALEETGRLEAIRASGTAVLEKIYQSGDGTLEGNMEKTFEALQGYNASMKELNLQEATQTAEKQAAVNTAGGNLADSVENMNAGTDTLLNDKLNKADEGVTNVQNATLTGNENVADASITAGNDTANALIAGANNTLDTATNVAGNISDVAGSGLQDVANATSTAINDNKNQQLSGVASVADVQSDALDTTTDVGTSGIEDVAGVASAGNELVRDTAKDGIGSIYDASIDSATGIRDTSIEGAGIMEGAQLKEAGLLGNQMRRMAMTGRRAAEDAYNQQLKGMRTQGIGQGTGANMRSAFAQNRANQAQGMFAPMAQADATQLGMESSARLGKVGAENDANLGFAMDKGIAGVGKAQGLAFADDNFATNQSTTNNQEAEGLAGINLAGAASQGEIDIGEAEGTAGILNDSTAQTGQNNINTASGIAGIDNSEASTVGDATNQTASTIATANTASVANTGEANVNKAASDAAANINAETGFTANQMDYLTGLIESNLSTNKNKVSADEIRMNNSLRDLGFTDPQIAALRTNLGYDLGEANQEFDNFNSLMNMRLGNLGMTANQASLMKYLAGAPTDITLGGLDPIARYSSPFTQRVMAPAHQSYINTSPYIPTATGGGGGGSFLDKFINFSNRYQNL